MTYDTLVLLIEHHNGKHFLMGSRRFGYNEDNSDYDVCVHLDDNEERRVFESLLMHVFCFDLITGFGFGYTGDHYRRTTPAIDVDVSLDVVIIRSREEFETLSAEHTLVRKYMIERYPSDTFKECKAHIEEFVKNGTRASTGNLLYKLLASLSHATCTKEQAVNVSAKEVRES